MSSQPPQEHEQEEEKEKAVSVACARSDEDPAPPAEPKAFKMPPPAEPKKPLVYRPFIATHEWQVIEHDHLLPPGLAIKFDFDADLKYARIPPPPPEPPAEEEAAAFAQAEPEAAEPAAVDTAEAAEEKKEEEAAEAPETAEKAADAVAEDIAAPLQSASADATIAKDTPPASGISAIAAAIAAAVKSVTNAASKGAAAAAAASQKAPKAPKGSRSMSTRARAGADGADPSVYSSARRPIVYPTFPAPTAEFLAARALMNLDRPVISVAPMVDVTDKHYRYLMRLISKHVLLYTPMIVDNALLRAPHAHSLYTDHQALEHPLVAQLGGSEADSMVRAAQRCEAQGFQSININVGCPAPSAMGHSYGACLMSDPTFPEVVRAMVSSVSIPVTIKCRIGVNKDDSYEFFSNFVRQCNEVGGVTHFIVHARKALLNLKSAGKNLTIPQLNYDFVYRIKQEMPHLRIEINGGVDDMDAAAEHIAKGVDGVMFGRLAWKQPYALSTVDARFYNDPTPPLSRKEVSEKYLQYVEAEWERNQREIAQFEKEHAAGKAEADPLVAAAKQADATQEQQHQAKEAAGAVTAPPPGLRHGESYLAQIAPPPLDARTLLKPLGYLYTHEPGYRRFRLLFEEGLLRHKEWSMRQIVERAMGAVEPPPARDWGQKDPGYEYTPAAKAEMEAARAALAQGGPAAANRHAQGRANALLHGGASAKAPAAAAAAAAATASSSDADAVGLRLALASLDGEAQCAAAAGSKCIASAHS